MKTPIQIPTEYEECVDFVDWLEQQPGVLFGHISNETFAGSYLHGAKQKNWAALARMKRAGVRSGLPDYFIATRKSLVFVEMKRIKSRPSQTKPEQLAWIERLNALGIPARVCRGAEEAKQFVSLYL